MCKIFKNILQKKGGVTTVQKYLSSPELKAQGSFSDNLLSDICPFVNF